jgi:hypothetical protein
MFSLSVCDFELTRLPVISTSWRRTLEALCLFVAAHGILFAQRFSDVPSYESLLDPTLERLKVADVGPWSISGIEFKLSYEFGPAFVKREKDSKLRCLNFMVYEKLLALDAERKGLDQWPDVKRQVSEIEADLVTEELYRDDVLKRVHVTDRQIASGVESERIQLKVRWIFTPTSSEMDEHIRKLKSGVSFDSLYADQLRSGQHAEDRSMNTTRFKLGMQNPMLASIADTMTAGTISLPVHGPDGWYLLNMVDVRKNLILTQSENIKLREEVRRALIQHIGDSLSDKYVQRIVGAHQPTILREPLNALLAHLGKIYLDKVKYDEWKLQERKGARELADVSELESIAMDTLVTMNSGSFSINDFREWFRMREPYVTLELASPVSFFHSVEELVWRMVRDRLLTQRAFARGLQNRLNVKRQVKWWKEKMLFTANKQSIGDTIVDSLPTLRKYYDDNLHHFADEQGHVRPFEAVKEDVWRDYYSQELTRRMLHEILRLRQEYGVKIDQASLNKIPVDNENDPKTIDVYPAKKGGIYPHAAFPSIDYDWQSWN